MKQYKEFLKDRFLVKLSFFTILTLTCIYVMFSLVKDYDKVIAKSYYTLSSIFNAFMPLWIGLFLAYLLNPLVNTIAYKLIYKAIPKSKREKLSEKTMTKIRLLAILVTYLLVLFSVIALLYGFASLLVGKLVFGNISELLQTLNKTFQSYESQFNSWLSKLPTSAFSEQIQDAINSAAKWFSNNINATSIIQAVTGFGSHLFNFFIGVILSIYLIVDKEFFINLLRKVIYLIFPKKSEQINNTLSEVNNILSKFVRGVLLDASIVGILMIVILSIFKVEFAIILGIFAGATNVIPYFGPFIGMIPAFAVTFFTDGFLKAIFVLLAMFVVQQVDANILYPKIVGSSMGLRPLFVLLSVIVFGYYMGIMGMILAVPITTILQLFIVKWAKNRERRLQESESLQSKK